MGLTFWIFYFSKAVPNRSTRETNPQPRSNSAALNWQSTSTWAPSLFLLKEQAEVSNGFVHTSVLGWACMLPLTEYCKSLGTYTNLEVLCTKLMDTFWRCCCNNRIPECKSRREGGREQTFLVRLYTTQVLAQSFSRTPSIGSLEHSRKVSAILACSRNGV